jgi:hypothetical protein
MWIWVEPHRVDVSDRLIGLGDHDPVPLPHVLRTMEPIYLVRNYKNTTPWVEFDVGPG